MPRRSPSLARCGRCCRRARRARPVFTHEEAAAFNANVVNRLKAEDDAAFVTAVRGLFDDMHFVYAGLGAAAAALVCMVIVLGMMRFAADERPDSLAAIVSVLATPLECDSVTDLGETLACRERWAERFSARTRRPGRTRSSRSRRC